MSEENKPEAEEKQEETTEAEAPAEEAKAEAPKEEPTEEKPAPKETKVNYVYGAMLLHSAGKSVDEATLKKVIEATGEKADSAQIKALVANLEGVDIDEAIKTAAVAAAPVAAAPASEEKAEEKPEDTEKKAEEAAAGLGSLFG